MKESSFWRSIKTGLETPGMHLSRIENVAGSGIPDLNGCYNGKELWIELKMFRGNQIHVRNSQLVWTTKHLRAKGDVVVLARKEDEIWVIEGRQLVAMASNPSMAKSSDGNSVTLVPPVEGALKVFHKPFDWASLRNLLFGE